MARFGDDPDASARVHCSHLESAGDPCATRYLWMRVQGGVMRALQEVTLADLVAFSARPQPVPAPLVAPSLAKELHA
jgi:DNA-binding IscR family transcriptional regulator